MSTVRRTLGLTVFALLLLELKTVFQQTDQAQAQTATIQSISGEGRVRIQREKRSDWTPARPGMTLNQGDQILPDRGVRTRVRCPDLSQSVLVKAGVPSGIRSICIQWASRIDRGDGQPDVAILGGSDATIPYLISPRHTLLLSRTPTIHWNAVTGASEYTVKVTSSAGVAWQTQTQANQIVYAGKPLQPGVAYAVTIQTNTGKSSQSDRARDQPQPAANLEFRILRPADAALIQVEAAKIARTTPTTEADVLDLARLYSGFILPTPVAPDYNLTETNVQSYTLTGEAIAVLQTFLQTGKASPILHRTLADLYWQTGLVHLAKMHYLQAIDRVRGLEDLEDWTFAHHSLGKMYAAIGDLKQTLNHYRQAKTGYVFLSDASLVEDLTRRIERLEKAIAHSP
ncbi:MAG: hypothetical protein IGS48_21930 [Oscillatoriales cyanobacterium C42_A2020_001]|nr:hypothetical protein [Leptolyngbyaceae cyanobacterium C42_A2020_001]